MDKLSLEGTSKTPTIKLDHEQGLIELEGRSIPENSVEFYTPIYNWLDDYSGAPTDKTTMNVKLEYFNTSSSKCILDVFRKVEKIKAAGKEVEVNWYYEEDDDDMLETGEDYKELTGLEFKMIGVEELF